jgi:hypothetical protein
MKTWNIINTIGLIVLPTILIALIGVLLWNCGIIAF